MLTSRTLSRRDLLKLAIAMVSCSQMEVRASPGLSILVLGGTGFLGPHQVSAALARGHRVTVFNRGKSGVSLDPRVEQLTGDRETGNLSSLRGRRWDAVIDNCRDSPGWLAESTCLLRDSVGHYLYVSSISAYGDASARGIKEDAPLQPVPQGEHNYGSAKVECERLVREAFPDRCTIPRPGLLVGPGDATDRFTYWPVRFAEGGEVLCPGSPSDPTQWLDARDASRWIVSALENPHPGVYNLAGPVPAVTMGEFLETVRATVRPDATLTWVPADFLDSQGIAPWMDMPCWVPPESSGFTSIDISKAVAAGLVTRPIAETVRDTLAWYRAKPASEPLKAGLSREREVAALKSWHQSSGAVSP